MNIPAHMCISKALDLITLSKIETSRGGIMEDCNKCSISNVLKYVSSPRLSSILDVFSAGEMGQDITFHC